MMKIIIKNAQDVAREDAHNGAGSRRLYIDDKQSPSERIQGMTHGLLPPGKAFDWHRHENIEEIMYVLKGSGQVFDREGEYTYKPGTVCIFPAGIEHKISNNTSEEHEFVFVRVYV